MNVEQIKATPLRSVRLAAAFLAACMMAPPALAADAAATAQESGYVTLHDAMQLKAYCYAYAHAPVDYREFGRYPGDRVRLADAAAIEPSFKATVDGAIAEARAHPDVVLDLKQIALRPYDTKRHVFPMDNRLFVDGVNYYFDVSPFHYRYEMASPSNAIACRDSARIATISHMVQDYRQFNMRVYGQVTGADVKMDAVVIHVRKVELLDDHDQVLLTQTMGN